MIDAYSTSPKSPEYDTSIPRFNDSGLVNEFDPKKDPLWYILRKEEITFEKTRRASEKMRRNKWVLASIN